MKIIPNCIRVSRLQAPDLTQQFMGANGLGGINVRGKSNFCLKILSMATLPRAGLSSTATCGVCARGRRVLNPCFMMISFFVMKRDARRLRGNTCGARDFSTEPLSLHLGRRDLRKIVDDHSDPRRKVPTGREYHRHRISFHLVFFEDRDQSSCLQILLESPRG